jgi:tellurium resistance protein TerZ
MAVALKKGERLSLTKEAGASLGKVVLGLGWDITPGVSQVDLDASVATFDGNKNLLETIYFGNKRSNNGSIQHSGDNLTGAGEGDDEQIVIDLSQVADNVQSIFCTVTSYRGQKFNVVRNAFVRVVNSSGGAELCRYELSAGQPYTGIILARIYRHQSEWKIAALGEFANGGTVKDLVTSMKSLL